MKHTKEEFEHIVNGDNILNRRDFMKTGAKTAVIAAAMTQFGFIEVFAQEPNTKEESADVIYLNGKVYTSNKNQKWAEAFALKGDKFVKVGTNKEVAALRGKETIVVDLKKHLVMPGLIDAHMHPDMAAENYFNVQIDELSTSYEEFREIVLKDIKENPEKEWVFGGNLDYLWDDGSDIKMFGKPTHKSIIDDIVSDKPAYFWEISGHAALVNTKALEVCGITKDTPDPVGGHYVKDENGELTGLLRELAATVVWEKFLDTHPPVEYIGDKHMKPVFSYLNSLGLTSVSDVWARNYFIESYNYLDRKDELSLRIAVYINDEVDFVSEERKKAARDAINNIDKLTSKQVSILGVKYILDGGAAGQTAVMLEPYEGSKDYKGPWRVSPEEYKEKLFKYDALGLSVNAHCAGDAATRLVLDSVEELRKKPGNNAKKLRHCVAHTAIVNKADRKRFAELDVICDFSPVFWYQMAAIDIVAEDIGKKRVGDMFPIKEIMDSGAHCGIGTDWFVTPADPWIAIETVVTRRAPGLKEGPTLHAEEYAISLDDAIHLYTMGSAYTQHRENEIGSIEEGKFADFIVVDQNIFEVPIYDVHKTKVLSTVLGGKDVYISEMVQNIIDAGELSGDYEKHPQYSS